MRYLKNKEVFGAVAEFVIGASLHYRVLFSEWPGRSPLGCTEEPQSVALPSCARASLCNQWSALTPNCCVIHLSSFSSSYSGYSVCSEWAQSLRAVRSNTLTPTHYVLNKNTCIAFLRVTSTELRLPLPSFEGDVSFYKSLNVFSNETWYKNYYLLWRSCSCDLYLTQNVIIDSENGM